MAMNRRELFKQVAATATVSGVVVNRVTAVELDSKPALALIECDEPISSEMAENMMHWWEQGLKGTPLEGVKAIVLGDGLKLTLLDSNGRALNRILKDEGV